MLGTALLVGPVSGLCSCLAKPSLCASQKPCTAKQRSSVGLSKDRGASRRRGMARRGFCAVHTPALQAAMPRRPPAVHVACREKQAQGEATATSAIGK